MLLNIFHVFVFLQFGQRHSNERVNPGTFTLNFIGAEAVLTSREVHALDVFWARDMTHFKQTHDTDTRTDTTMHQSLAF